MRLRPITALMAALALLAAVPVATRAQDPTPTPTPTAAQSQDDGSSAEPPAGASTEVKAVYDDYAQDGRIEVCDHTRDVLQETLDSIPEDVDRDFPDFREAVRAGIQRHDDGRCSEATPTPTATATATTDPLPTATAESGDLPDAEDDGTTDDGALPPPEDGTLPPDDGTAPPLDGTVPPPATAPVPVPPVVAAVSPTPTPTPVVVSRSGSGSLLVPGLLIGFALLGGGALAAAAFGAHRSESWNAAFNEAAFRVRGTWADFSDWLRIGR